MLNRSLTKRVVALAVLVTGAAVATAVWSMQGSGAARAAQQTVTAARGDVVVAVGGVGRVVEARQSGPIAVAGGTSTTGGGASTPSTATTAPPDSVFPSASGHVARYLVQPGQRIAAGAPIALLDDGGTAAISVAQARGDLASAQLELRQKQTHDPSQGLPALPAEVRAASLALQAARERARQIAHPRPADIASARLDVRKARADLETLLRRPLPAALTAARLVVAAATQRLAKVERTPTAADVAAAGAELARAQADLDALLKPGTPLASAVRAAQAVVDAANQKLAQLTRPNALDVASARAELAKAQADLDALQQPGSSATTSAVHAAQTAVDVATQRLAQVSGPPNPVEVATAQSDLQKAQAELDTLLQSGTPLASAVRAAQAAVDVANQRVAQVGKGATPADVATARAELQTARSDQANLQRPPTAGALTAGRFAVSVAERHLAQLLHPSAADLDSAQSDAAKAAADLEVLLRRGGPATPTDIAIARVKLQAANAHLRTALLGASRLTVRTPVAGTVTGLLAARGAPADPSTPIATVADLRHLAVSVDLSEFDVAKVKRGDRALLAVDALGGKTLGGRVVFVALTGVDSGGVVNFPVRVALTRSAAVKPGMNVSVKIIVAERRHVVRVPLEAVRGATVSVMSPSGPRTRRVTLGLADNKQVEVTSGLRAGERVLLGAQGA